MTAISAYYIYAYTLPKEVTRMSTCSHLPPTPHLPNVRFYFSFCYVTVFLFLCISHWTYIAPSSIVSGQIHSVWSLEYLLWRALWQMSMWQSLSCTTVVAETRSSKTSLEDCQLICGVSSPLESTIMRMVAPTPASASLHQVSTDSIVVVYSSLVCHQ